MELFKPEKKNHPGKFQMRTLKKKDAYRGPQLLFLSHQLLIMEH